jgi:hypothetical protein
MMAFNPRIEDQLSKPLGNAPELQLILGKDWESGLKGVP